MNSRCFVHLMQTKKASSLFVPPQSVYLKPFNLSLNLQDTIWPGSLPTTKVVGVGWVYSLIPADSEIIYRFSINSKAQVWFFWFGFAWFSYLNISGIWDAETEQSMRRHSLIGNIFLFACLYALCMCFVFSGT